MPINGSRPTGTLGLGPSASFEVGLEESSWVWEDWFFVLVFLEMFCFACEMATVCCRAGASATAAEADGSRQGAGIGCPALAGAPSGSGRGGIIFHEPVLH